MVVATGRASRIAGEWFIHMTVEPFDDSRVLINTIHWENTINCFLCWQFQTLKQRPNYFPIILLSRPKCYVLPPFCSFSSISSWFDLKPKRREGKKKVEKGLEARGRRNVDQKRGKGRKTPPPHVLVTLHGKGSLLFLPSLWLIMII